MLPATLAAAAGGQARRRAGGVVASATRRLLRPRAVQPPPPAPTAANAAPPRRAFFSFATAAPPPSTEELFKRVRALHESVLKPNNTRYLGPLGRDTDELIPLPVVLVVGNHSAGKSTFINYVLGRQVQSTGVAPTDDSFTLVAPGQADADQDGPSLVGDPTWGLGGLRQFGTQLINHVSLKIRSGTALKDVLIVDSPGMIDAPVSPAQASGGGGMYRDSSRDRGYNFPATMRWFAERADLILLFQDPAKPGTTGETLDIMTTALAGQDYKTLIVLNKADVFTNVHDFARAYGALTWNLSKVRCTAALQLLLSVRSLARLCASPLPRRPGPAPLRRPLLRLPPRR
jgi:GTPase SAR1 family protein